MLADLKYAYGNILTDNPPLGIVVQVFIQLLHLGFLLLFIQGIIGIDVTYVNALNIGNITEIKINAAGRLTHFFGNQY